jgi:hypothetical protein
MKKMWLAPEAERESTTVTAGRGKHRVGRVWGAAA